MPNVTVIVPNYNHGPYLRKRIESIFNQTFQEFELILLDDASSDNSTKILHSYANHPKVTIYYNKTNSGSPFIQWSKGLNTSIGEYVWIAESDDVAHEEFLDKTVKVLDKHPDVGLVYTQSIYIDEKGKKIGSAKIWTDDIDTRRWAKDFIMNGVEFCSNYLIKKNVIPNASAVVSRRSLWMPFDKDEMPMKLCGDWMQWAKILEFSNVAFLNEPYNYFRSHKKSARVKITEGTNDIVERYQVVSYIGSKFPVKHNIIENSFNCLLVILTNRLFKVKGSVIAAIFQFAILASKIKKYDNKLFRRLIYLIFNKIFL